MRQPDRSNALTGRRAARPAGCRRGAEPVLSSRIANPAPAGASVSLRSLSFLVLLFNSRLPCSGANHYRSSSLLQIGFQKAFRHALHSKVGMWFYPPRRSRIVLQHSMIRRTMFALAYIVDLSAYAGFVLAAACVSGRKPHRIPRSLARQSATTLGVAKVAELPQFFRRRSFMLVSRSGAVATPSAAQRKPLCMRPASI